MNYSTTARKSERRVQQQAGQKAQQCNTNDDVDTPHFDDRVAQQNMH